MAVFWCYFRDFIGAQKFDYLTEPNFFGRSISNNEYIRFTEKNSGARCTLKINEGDKAGVHVSDEICVLLLINSQVRQLLFSLCPC